MPAKKRSSSKSRPRTRKRGWLRTLLRWSLLPLLALTMAGVLYGIYLDQVVQSRFEGQRWTLPARVYARPLELFAGRRLSADHLQEELERLGYTRSKHPDRPGSYSRYRQRFLLRTRPFRFWDGEEPSRYLEVKFSGGKINTMKPAGGGADPGLARLDAAHIGTIHSAHHEDRILVQRKDLPELLVKTLLTVEDRHFYQHFGVDPVAILRALWRNIRAGRVVQGGSTLTQQLIKNFYLTNKRSLPRKLNEAAMALLLELRYEKDEILEAYANEIYLGQDGKRAIHGFGLASHFYFNRPLAELDLSQVALLVGMIKGPSHYNPRRHPERARKRRDLVLDVLQRQGVASAEQVAAAKKAELGAGRKGGRPTGRYPAFMQLVRRQLKRDYQETDLNSEGLRIFTTLDPLVQSRTEKSIASRLPKMEKSKRSAKLEAAAVVAGSESGEVLALVGGRRSGYSGFNRALEAERPIGSLIKPVVYLEALSRPDRYTPITLLNDTPVRLKGRNGKLWRPKNFDKKSHGRVPLYQALARSYNLATVNLGMELGLERVVARLNGLGLEREVPPLPSLLLGSLALTPLEVTQLYQGLAAGGFRAPLRAVREVLDANGQSLSRYPLKIRQVADPGPVHLINWVMGQVVQQGTGRGLKKQLPKGLRVAGKTGTSDDYRDSWFAGFSGDKVAVVWVGRDDNKPAGISGSSGAMRVWGDIIGGSDSAPLALSPPGGVENLWVELAEGLLADSHCPGALQAPFLSGSAPRRGAACMGGAIPGHDTPAGGEPGWTGGGVKTRRKEAPAQGETKEKNPVESFFERFFQ